MAKQSQKFNIPLTRWPSIYGKDVPYDQLRELGIGHAMVRSDRYDAENRNLRNMGIVGCFLSARSLLEHLYSLPNVNSSHGHLIVEDDVVLPADLTSTSGRMLEMSVYLPEDWDLYYLGIWHLSGVEITKGLVRLESGDRVNVGAFAFVVRHGSLGKIIEWLRYMIDAYDEQLTLRFDKWKAYALVPNYVIMNVDINADSSINKIN